jgi:hypothetical protein
MLWGRRRTGGQVDRSVDFGHSTSSRSKLRPILPSLSAGRDTQTHLVSPGHPRCPARLAGGVTAARANRFRLTNL